MMLVGDKSRFAVEFEPVLDGNEVFPNCLFTYWIDGRVVGNPDLSLEIGIVTEELRGILSCRRERNNQRLFGLPAQDLLLLIADWIADPYNENWKSYDLTYWMTQGYPPGVGRRFEIRIVESGASCRIVVANADSGLLAFELYLDAGEADAVILEAYNMMSEAYSRMHGA
jgi:hypothetical protein